MILYEDMTLDQFEDEMQLRVVKFGPKSRAAREALQFARLQSDPNFFRVASDKINAQTQFLRETYGPSKLETFYLAARPFFPKEVVMTVLLLSASIIGYDLIRTALAPANPNAIAPLDIDELSRRMSVEIRENATLSRRDLDAIKSDLSTGVGQQLESADWRSLLEAKMQSAFEGSGLAESTVNSVVSNVEKIDINELVAKKVQQAIASVSISDLVAQQLEQSLQSPKVSELLQAEVSKVVTAELARQESKMQESFDHRIVQLTDRLAEMVDKKLAAFSEELTKANAQTREAAANSASKLVEGRLASFETELKKNADQRFAERAEAIDATLNKLQTEHAQLPGQLKSQFNDFLSSEEFSSVVAKSILRSLAKEQNDEGELNQ